jgi:hypothetical protein
MITLVKRPGRPKAQENEQFLEFIPTIKCYARRAFRNFRPDDREEAIAEVLANAFSAFRRLAELGKLDVAYPSPLARFAIARFKSGRQVGNKTNSRDVFSFVAQRRQGFSLESLQADDGRPSDWVELLADNTLTPVADQVAFRLDFCAWLGTQNGSARELAEYLALGNTPSEASQRFGVSRARISQRRRSLKASWQSFQGESR